MPPPLKTHGEQKVLNNLLPGETTPPPDGCRGEAGTLAITRPDISAMVRLRKEEEIQRAIGHRGEGASWVTPRSLPPAVLLIQQAVAP